MSETGFVSLYVTASSLAEGERLGRALIEERLAACVNIVPGIVSMHRWEGAVRRDEEVLLFAKTRESLAEAARQRLAELHGYDVPCILSLPIVDGHPAYLAWLAEQTDPSPGAAGA